MESGKGELEYDLFGSSMMNEEQLAYSRLFFIHHIV